MSITVLRLGHRIHRDQRISSHVFLVARAFGARKGIYSGERDKNLENSIKKVVKQWGGPFDIKYIKKWQKYIEQWKGDVIHLTMYGINLPNMINKIREVTKLKDLLVLVGSQKVEKAAFELSDYNIAIVNTPHSEVSSLAIFLHELFKGKELCKKFKKAKMEITPNPRGKSVRILKG